MSLEIINPGFLSLVQDFGRYGMQKYGITNSGPMDEHAFLWANRLLGNHHNAAQLEICMGGFAARFHKETVISICGAQSNVTLNGHVVDMWQTHCIKPGDEIRVDAFSTGLYAYLAVKGGLQVQPQLSSVSTVMREKLGGLHQNGKKLSNKENIPYEACSIEFQTIIPRQFKPNYTDNVKIRFTPNQSETGCTEESIADFVGQSFKVTAEINRMGYRLKGAPIKSDRKGIVSQGISVGAIQLPQDGQPIVLMKDRQTIGGYPQLGCIAYLDLCLLSQSRPGATVSFEVVDMSELEGELISYMSFFDVSY